MEHTSELFKNRFLRFAIVGISGTVVDFGLFNIFSILFSIPVILSSIFSFSVAVFNNFYWNRVWTYPESKKLNLAGQLFKFGVVSILGLIIRTPLFVFIESPVIEFSRVFVNSEFPVDAVIIGHNLALGIVVVVVLFWNFFINKFWTYKDIDSSIIEEN